MQTVQGAAMDHRLGPRSPGSPAVGSSTIVAFCLLVFVLSTFLLTGGTRCSSLILCISFPSPRVGHSSKEPRFLLLENVIRNQDSLSLLLEHCCFSAPLSSQSRETCVYVCARADRVHVVSGNISPCNHFCIKLTRGRTNVSNSHPLIDRRRLLSLVCDFPFQQ